MYYWGLRHHWARAAGTRIALGELWQIPHPSLRLRLTPTQLLTKCIQSSRAQRKMLPDKIRRWRMSESLHHKFGLTVINCRQERRRSGRGKTAIQSLKWREKNSLASISMANKNEPMRTYEWKLGHSITQLEWNLFWKSKGERSAGERKHKVSIIAVGVKA